MTEDERKALGVVQAGVEMLRNAITERDPLPEIDLRARDILADVNGILAGNAHVVAGFPPRTE